MGSQTSAGAAVYHRTLKNIFFISFRPGKPRAAVRAISRWPWKARPGLRSLPGRQGTRHPGHSLVVLALILGDVQLRVQLVQQRVGALLAQRVIHVRLPGHNVKEVTGDLRKESPLSPLGTAGSCRLVFNRRACAPSTGKALFAGQILV